jgi:anti-sigma factor RsiW
MKKCLDEATIQAYADGELEAARAQAAGAHLAQCDACAARLAEAEEAGAFFASAFAPDAGVAVPTEVLRARIGAAVAGLADAPETRARRPRGWDFGALLAPFSGLFTFTPQRAAGFAAVLAVVALGVVLYAVRQRTTPVTPRDEIARETRPTDNPPAPPAPSVSPTGEEKNVSKVVESGDVQPPPRIHKTPTPRRVNKVRTPTANVAVVPAPTPEALVPGEKNYREAIASLEKAVSVGMGDVLVPTARIEYERNIAVLDRAIAETRAAALRNPKDKDAVGFLMSAYQSKVELLSTVAEQTQVAAVGR